MKSSPTRQQVLPDLPWHLSYPSRPAYPPGTMRTTGENVIPTAGYLSFSNRDRLMSRNFPKKNEPGGRAGPSPSVDADRPAGGPPLPHHLAGRVDLGQPAVGFGG